MEKYIYDKNKVLWYELQGDYYIPCLILIKIDISLSYLCIFQKSVINKPLFSLVKVSPYLNFNFNHYFQPSISCKSILQDMQKQYMP